MHDAAVTAPPRRPIAVSLAWRRYLVATRTAEPDAYERVEDAAWQRLREELAAVGEPRRLAV